MRMGSLSLHTSLTIACEEGAAAVVNDKLYVDGGILWLSPKGEGKKELQVTRVYIYHKLPSGSLHSQL